MKLQTIRAAAATTGVNETVIRRAVRSGQVESLRIGNRSMVDLEQLGEYLSREPREGITAEELSKETGLAVSAIRRGVKTGWLPGWKSAHGTWRFDLEEVTQAIRQKMQSGPQKEGAEDEA